MKSESKYNNIHTGKRGWESRLQNDGHFVLASMYYFCMAIIDVWYSSSDQGNNADKTKLPRFGLD